MRLHVSATTLLIVVLFSSFWGVLGGSLLIHSYKNDFLCYYIGGALARQRDFADLYRPAAQAQMQQRAAPGVQGARPYVRPPWFALAVAPLTALTLIHAYAVWIGVMLAVLLGTWAWCAAWFGETALVLACLFLPANLGLCFGQDSAVMLAIVCLFFVLLARNKPFLSGMVLGAGLFKPHLLLLFPLWMLLQRRWRMLGGLAASASILLAIALLTVGPRGMVAYVDLLRHGNTELGHSPDQMLNIYALPANFGIESPPLNALLAAGLIAIAVLALRRAPAWLAIGIASAGSLLISPHTLGYDATLLLLTIWLVMASPAGKACRYSALVLCAPVTFFFLLAHRPLHAIPALALLIFFAALAAETRRHRIEGPGWELPPAQA